MKNVVKNFRCNGLSYLEIGKQMMQNVCIKCEKVLGQIGIAFQTTAKPIVFNRPQVKFSADLFLFTFRGQRVSKNQKVHMTIAQLTIDNFVI